MDIQSTSYQTQPLNTTRTSQQVTYETEPAVIDKAMVAKLVSQKLLQCFGNCEANNPTPQEETISQRIFQSIRGIICNKFYGSMDLTVKCSIGEQELYTDNIIEDPDFQYTEPSAATQGELVPMETMRKAVEAFHEAKKNKLKAAQKHSKQATHATKIKRWELYLQKGGNKEHKIQIIKKHMWQQFIHYRRQLKLSIHDRHLKTWAINKAFDIGMPSFKASRCFLSNFKAEHKIKGRKVTHIVTQKNLFPQLSLQPLMDNFRDDLTKMIQQNKYALHNIVNTDQSGFQYEMSPKRTLDFIGAKNVESSVKNKNKTTHSYTVQMTIAADGRPVGPLLIILQEQKGVFGKTIQSKLQTMSPQNIIIKCSKSGKSTKEIAGEYLQTIKEYIGNEKGIVLLDQWSGQTDCDLFFSKMGCHVQPIFFPPQTTQYLQPLDVYFFHDYKYFIKRMAEYCATHQNICGEVDLTQRESIIQMHEVAYNQLCSPTFDEMRCYAFEKSLFRSTNPVFRTVKQVCFSMDSATCSNCVTPSFIVCAWCWKNLCFHHFYSQKHYHS